MSSTMKSDSGFYTFTWKIKNFSFCPEIRGHCLKSPKFIMGTGDEIEWELEVYPYGRDSSIYISCDLRLLSSSSVTATWKISIDGADGSAHYSHEMLNRTFPNANFSGIGSFVKRDEIFSNKNFYLPKDILTVRCEIKRRIIEMPIKHCSVRSEIGIKRISVKWDINNFSNLSLEQQLRFPFSLNLEKESNFEILFSLDGDFLESSYLQLNIMKICLPTVNIYTQVKDYGPSITMFCEISILDFKGIPAMTVEGTRFFEASRSNVMWQLPALVKRLTLRTQKSLYLIDDVLSLRFQFVVSVGNIQSFPAEIHAIYPGSHVTKLSTIIRILNRDQNISRNRDISLVTGSKTLKAQKAVLASKSPVFKAIFEHDMAENNSGTVNIVDVDSKTLEHMVLFMYADHLEDVLFDLKSCMKLFCAADKYQINALKEYCYPIIKSLVSAENVSELLPMAYKFCDDSLKTIAKSVIWKHPSETMESDVWERLMEEKWNESRLMPLTADKQTSTLPCQDGAYPRSSPPILLNRLISSDEAIELYLDSEGSDTLSPAKKLKL